MLASRSLFYSETLDRPSMGKVRTRKHQNDRSRIVASAFAACKGQGCEDPRRDVGSVQSRLPTRTLWPQFQGVVGLPGKSRPAMLKPSFIPTTHGPWWTPVYCYWSAQHSKERSFT